MGSSTQETQHQEDSKIGSFKTLLYITLMMGGATILVLAAAVLALMYLSYGDHMWPILFKLKIGPGP